jgi:hypothetical protein
MARFIHTASASDSCLSPSIEDHNLETGVQPPNPTDLQVVDSIYAHTNELPDSFIVNRARANRDHLPRINAPHGLSHKERNLLCEGMDYLRQQGLGVFLSIEAGRDPEPERKVRELMRRVNSDLAVHRRRAGMRRILTVRVFEALGRDGLPKFGAHIVAIMPSAAARDRVIESLNTSRVYGKFVLAKPVTNWDRLTKYLLKEATQQAAYRKGFRRIGGSIPLGELGGDRVILSPDLKETLLRRGRIAPYKRTYAKRLESEVMEHFTTS